MLGEYAERQAAQDRLLLYALGRRASAIFLLLRHRASGAWRLALLVLPRRCRSRSSAACWPRTSPAAMISLGSLVGFFTVLGIAARNGIMMINHFQHLERVRGRDVRSRARAPRGAGAAVADPDDRARDRAGLVPLVISGDRPGHEIEHPMAIVILGGLVTSTLLNLFVVPSLYLRFGRPRRPAGGS